MITTIQQLNYDPKVHAILLQLPLDSENVIDADRCTNTIDINKVSLCNSGELPHRQIECLQITVIRENFFVK